MFAFSHSRHAILKNIDVMNEKMEIVQSMIDYNSFDKQTLIEILQSFGNELPIVRLILSADQKIIRTRCNNNADFFYTESELSYPPKEFARTDRASLEGNPMFYASIFTSSVESNNAYPRIISALETVDLIKDKTTSGSCLITQGVWTVDNPIKLFSFPMHNGYARACNEIVFLQEAWENVLVNQFPKESVEFFSYIGRLMAAPKRNCLYNVTSTCVDYVLSRNTDCGGILYPSVPSSGEGINICVNPSIVNSHVSLEGAMIEWLVKNKSESTIYNIARSNKISNDEFEWLVTEDGKKILLKLNLIPKHLCENEIAIRRCISE